MLANVSWKLKSIGKRTLQILLCVLLLLQTAWLPGSASAESTFYFRGYDSENVTTNTFAYATSGASLDGTTVTMTSVTTGMAVGYISLNEDGHDISTSVDLGSLEIDFSTVSTVAAEGTDGSENDIPSVTIDFCTTSDIGSSFSQITLTKSDNTVSGDVALSSGASIPANTRGIFITLSGENVSGDNTVVFSGTSFVIHDAAAPSCEISYDSSWTNGSVTVTISAADSDSGLEGIYFNDAKVTTTSPYTFTVSESGTSFTAYSKDYAGKTSETQSATVNNIDTVTPDAPSSVPLSATEWTNEDVQVLMPELGASTGAPESYVYQIGASAWQTLPSDFVFAESGLFTIRVAVQDEAGNRSTSAESTARIDKIAPTIDSLTQTSGSGYSRVDITYSDGGLSGINTVRYAEGEQTADYFAENGTDIADGTFTVASGGTYTVCVSDGAGNTALQTIMLSTAPTLGDIADTSMGEDDTLNIPLSASDAETPLDQLIISASASDTDLIPSITVKQTAEAASIDITPAANAFGGPVTITVQVQDEAGLTASDTFTLTVNSVNDLPVAVDDTGITVDEDSFVKVDVLANDYDTADGDTLTIDSCGTPEHGIAVVVLGEVKYTPEENYTGDDSFTYTISDGNGGEATATVSVTVSNVNDAPVAVDDNEKASEDGDVLIDVLANDTDADLGIAPGETLSLASVTNGTHGTAAIEDGKVRYTPSANYNGEDAFTYTIQDAEGSTSTASVYVDISPMPDDPWFEDVAEEYTIYEDCVEEPITFSIYDVETSADSLMLQAALPDETLISANNLVISGLGDSDPAISLLLTPRSNLSGDVTINLALSDGFVTKTTSILVHILPVNDAPSAAEDTITYDEDTEYVDIPISQLISNDTDADGDSLSFAGIATFTTVGELVQLDETTLRYTPLANYEGDDSFTYTVSDGTLESTGTCKLSVTPANDAPTITLSTSSYSTEEDVTITGITFSIYDEETAAADLVLVGGSSDTDLIPTDGISIINNGDGTCTLSITPAPDANGTATVTITVSDGSLKDAKPITLTITATQDAPIAVEDYVYVPISGKRVFSVLENDHDIDGDALSVTGYDDSTLPGTLFFNSETQQFTYYAASGENTVSTFTYTISDEIDTATGTVTLDVNSIMHAPVISTIFNQYITEDSSISGISFNVTDEDYGDTATISVSSSNESILPVDGTHVVVTDNGSGSYSLALTPLADKSGSVTVTVTATDSSDLSDSTSFTLSVAAQNDAPIAVADTIETNEDTSVTLNMLDNDSDPDGDSVWVRYIDWPSHGTLSRTSGVYTYTPYGNWNGTETIGYTLTDGSLTSTTTITIVVNPVNDAPVTWSDYCELPNTIGQTAGISVMNNDYDPDGDTIHVYEIVTQPSFGTVEILPDGKIRYTRTAESTNSNGLDTFVYQIIDRDTATGDYLTRNGTVYVGIDFIDSLYTYGRSVHCMEDADAFTFDLSISNPNSVTYELTVDETTDLGTFEVIDNNTVRFTPAANANGYQAIQYTVAEVGGGESDTGTIWLTVYSVNDAPVLSGVPAEVSFDEDSSGVQFAVTAEDVDNDISDLYFSCYTQSVTSNTAAVMFDLDYSITKTETGAIITIYPDDNVSGTATVVVRVSDGMASDSDSTAVTVNAVDDAPALEDFSVSTYEDIVITFGVIGPDNEVDGDDTVFAVLEGNEPANGSVTVNANNTLTYTPDADFFGTDTFQYTMTDQTTAALSTTKTATVTVTPINDQPEIFDLDYYQTTLEDTTKDVTLTVHDVDNDLTGASSYTITSDNTDLIPNENISISNVEGEQMKITVIPVENASGTAVISIIASDGTLTARAAFQIKVIPVNDVPVAVDDATEVNENVSATGGDDNKTTATLNLTANDSDIEDSTLKIISIYDIQNGTVVNTSGGDVTVYADGDFSGDVTFSYTIMDSNGATADANVTVTIVAQNDPPRASDDSLTINEDETIAISVLDNDTDVEGDTLTIDSVTTPENGSVEFTSDTVTYTPTKDYYGPDSFQYTVSDGNGGTATATVTITINPLNDAPVIAKHSSNLGTWTMEEDGTASFNFVVSDAEAATENLLITIDSQDETLLLTSEIALSANADGYKTITVHSEKDMYGTVPVRFIVSDGLLTTTETYDIVISPVNDRPVVDSAHYEIPEDSVLNETITASDLEGNSLTFAKQTDPSNGTVTVNEDGTFTYTPDSDFTGSDSFSVIADDGQSVNNIGYGIITITVTPEFDAPVAVDDPVETNEDVALDIYVLDNDTDEDIPYGDSMVLVSVTTPSHGSATVTDNYVVYTPDENYNGSDAFTYLVSDQDGNTATANVMITVTPVNDQPSDGDDTAETTEDHAVTIPATDNDDIDETTNPDLEDLTIISVADPANGTAAISSDKKSITYTPDENFYTTEGNPEVFTYTVEDSGGLQNTFNISVTVEPINDVPEIRVEEPLTELPDVEISEDTTSGAVAFTVFDVEDAEDTLDVAITHNNSSLLPTLSVTPDASGNCSFTITPKANKVGTATITVTVTDSKGATDTDSFVLTVNAVNDVPVAVDDAATTNENTAATINVLQNDDVDLYNGGDTLSILTVNDPQYGTYAISNNQVIYTPDADHSSKVNYTDTFGYTMKDASGAESSANITVTITPVNDAPTISAIDDVTGVQEDTPTDDISFTVTDEEDDDDTLQIYVASSNETLFPLANIVVTNIAEGEDATGTMRTVQVTPAEDQFGTATITLTVKDAEGKSASESFSVTVESVNDVPIDGNDNYVDVVYEDVETQLFVLTNDDPDDPSYLTVTAIPTAPVHGTVRIADDNKSVYYTTDLNSNENDSFTYTVHDSYGNADYTFTVTLNVVPVNDAPVITYNGDASYTVNETVAENGIPFTVTDIDNNTDLNNGEDLGVVVTAKSSNSLLLKDGITIVGTTGDNRELNLQPYAKWNGSTTVTITVTDNDGLTDTASFTFIVNSVNDAPVAYDDTYAVNEDALTTLNVMFNDRDEELMTNPDEEVILVNEIFDDDPNAVITASADNKTILIQPNANYNGPVSFSYNIHDALNAVSNTATVTVTVLQVNDAPEPDGESVTLAEDGTITIDVLDGDTDVDQQAGLNADPTAEVLHTSIDESDLLDPQHGTIELDGDSIKYTPVTDYNGPDSFEYYCDDGETQVKATVSVTVTQVNDNPAAVSDSATTPEDTQITIDALSNDTDVDTNTNLNKGTPVLVNTLSITGATLVNSEHGTVTITDNKIVYDPAANWFGSETITYTIADGDGGTATGTVSVTVTSVNDLPEFTLEPSNLSFDEDGSDATSVTVTDVETADSELAVTFVSSTNESLIDGSCVSITAGTGGDRTITVTPKGDQNGTATITIKVTDGNNADNDGTITFTVTVASINDDPVAQNTSFTIAEDSGAKTVTGTNVTSDVDIATNSDTLTLTITTAPTHGTAEVTDGNLVYTPDENFNGTDSYGYTVTDSHDATDTATVSITVTQVNDAPEPDGESVTLAEDGTITIDVLDGDTDVDQQAGLNADPTAEVLHTSIDESDLLDPQHGTIELDGDSIKYTPVTDYNGPDSFEYYCDDGETQVKATVSVTVTQVNDNPAAVSDSATTPEDTQITIDALSNDTDVDTNTNLNKGTPVLVNTLSITGATLANSEHGTVTITDNKIVYDPAANWFGSETITYTIADGDGGTATGTVSVTVTSVNDLPEFTLEPSNLSFDEDGSDATSVTVTDVETADSELAVTFVSSTNESLIDGSCVSITAGTGGDRTITVTPKGDQNGTATITIKVTDGNNADNDGTITFTVTVASINDDPVAQNTSFTIAEDSGAKTVTGTNVTSDVDIATNSDTLTLTITTAPTHGTAEVTDGNLVYTPDENFNGTDSYGYTVTDSHDATDTATVSITVTQVNDAPEPDGESVTLAEDGTITIDVLDGDTDVDQQAGLNADPTAEVLHTSIDESDLLDPQHGTIELDGDSIKYTPVTDYNGPDSFEYYCDDGETQVKATVSVTVTQVNDNPAAVSDSATTPEDTQITIDALSNDTDVDTNTNLNKGTPVLVNTLSITGATLANSEHGTVTITDNKIVYDPAANWFGSETITYTIADGDGGTATGTVSVTVTSVNDLPEFTLEPSNLSFDEDGSDATSVTVTDVETADSELAVTFVSSTNESLIDGSCVSITAGTGGDRTITVTPKGDQNGTATITIKVTDGNNADNDGTITFTVTVASINDDPVAQNTSFTIAEDSGAKTVTGTNVTSDVDIATNSDTLTLTITTAPTHGTAEVTDGNLVYTPDENFNGTDSYGYTVTDSHDATDTATVSITVTQVNDAPEPDGESVTLAEDGTITIDVLDGDTDVDQQAGLNADPTAEVLHTSIDESDLLDPQHGTIELDGDSIKYTPVTDYNGPDSFEYYCDDGETQVKATVSVTVTQVNDNPAAVSDSATTPDEIPVSVNVLENDTDVDTGDTLNKDVQYDRLFSITDYYFTDGSHGTLSEENGVITYTPSLNFTGTQKITYVMSDGYGGSATGTLTVLVNVENDAPVAYDDTLDTAEDTPKTINVLTNDTDQDPGDTLSFVAIITETSGLPGSFGTSTNGDVTFTPDANYHGTFTVTYQMRDAAGLLDTATISISVSAVNDTPQANTGEAATQEDTAKAINVSGLISDADIATDGDALSVSVGEADEPEHGTLAIEGTVITYTPDANWNGTDSFYYTATDKEGASARALISIAVLQVNDSPVAVADSVETKEDTGTTLNPVTNDTDVDTDADLNAVPMSTPVLVSVSTPEHGTATKDGNQVTYTPNENFNGADSFTYTISDGTVSVTGAISVLVTQVNDQVQPVDDEATTTDEDAITIDVLANDLDVDTNATFNLGTLHYTSDYSIVLVGAASHGSTEIKDGKIVYTPEDTFNGTDGFTYTMSDGHGSTASATVSVTVLSVNDPPETPIVSSPAEGDRAGGDSIVHVVWSCFDIDGDVLTYTLEYYYDGTWTVVDSALTATEYDFAIPSSVGTTDGLKFRVKASDAEFTTDYGYSGAMSVDRDAPLSVTVSMTKADGSAYVEGTWTNQSVTVTATGADDANPVTFQYAMDGDAYSDVPNMTVETGEHSVYILATDVFSNSAEFGGYLAKVDKQAPAVPTISEQTSDGSIIISFKLKTDPGGSGNDRLVLPNGKTLSATATLRYSVTRNGTYTFLLYDAAGNKTTFSYTVSSVDTSQPVITARYGTYRIGETTQDDITVQLTFTDGESEITARGYELGTSVVPSGIYRDYASAITISGVGTYYVHAYAMNAFGLTTYETFGPFIIEAAPVVAAEEATVTPTPKPTTEPEYGDVEITTEDIEGIEGETVYIRLPGEEWGETLTLENVSPGEYYIEAMDDSGNIHTVKVHVTMRDIIARSLRNARDSFGAAAIAGASLAAAALVLIILLLAGYNITVSVYGFVLSQEKRVHLMRRVMFRKEVLVVKLKAKHVRGGKYAVIRLAKILTKRMRNRTIVVEIEGREVLRELIPEDMDKAFKRKIPLGE